LSAHGTPIDPRNFNRHVNILTAKAGIRNIQSHIFRHTFISLAVKNHVDPRILKRIIGHANTGITDAVYTHMYVDDLRGAMEKMKLNQALVMGPDFVSEVASVPCFFPVS
jgi:site-specific recombinase XerD